MIFFLRNGATVQLRSRVARAGARMRRTLISRCIVAEKNNTRLFNTLRRNGGRNGVLSTVADRKNASAARGLGRNGGRTRIKYAGKFTP